MIVGDLFSGIGGFSLAAEWMGWRTAWFSEIDPFASRVLAHHWPDVPNHGNITRIDWTTVEPVDVLTGGFPCQPHSLAGKRLASSDERDLFSEIIRAVRVLRPRFVVLENVRGLLTSESGRFFGRVLGSLAECGYDAEWRVLSAADVGAPHKRERVWIIAELADAGRSRQSARGIRGGQAATREVQHMRAADGGEAMAHANGRGQQERTQLDRESAQHPANGNPRGAHADGCGHVGCASVVAHASSFAERESTDETNPVTVARRARNEPRNGSQHGANAVGERLERVIEGRSATRTVNRSGDGSDRGWWATEPDVGRVAHGVPARVDRLRCLGNSIVPRCALEIFRTIDAMTRQERAA